MNKYDIFPLNVTLLLLLVLILFVVCIKEQPVQPDPPAPPDCDLPDELDTNVLIPLTAGNWWKYEKTTFSFSEEPNLKDSLMWRIHENTIVYYKDQSFSAAVIGWYDDKEDIVHDRRWLYINNDEGLNVIGGISQYDTVLTKYVFRKFPINVGDSWKIQELVFDFGIRKFVFSDTLLFTCIATDRPRETPAGTFQCYVYYYQRSLQGAVTKRETYIYYAPGIGWIGLDERNVGMEGFLYSFSLYACRVR